MISRTITLLICIVAIIIGNSIAQTTHSIKSLPPVVVETFPRSGDSAVDPSVKEIKVTFSKDMKTEKMWSWVMVSKETFPKIVGDVHYLENKRTYVAPVELERGKTYVIWINSEKYNAFKAEDGNPAVPYLLVFDTSK